MKSTKLFWNVTTYDKDLYEKTLKEDAREEGRVEGRAEIRAELNFRSALELLKLIDGALDNNYEVRIEE